MPGMSAGDWLSPRAKASSQVPGSLPGGPVEAGGGGYADQEGLDVQALVGWMQRRFVLVAGLLLIAVPLIWKAQFLRHEYFRQDDFYLLDLAHRSRFSWAYLTYIGSGHLMIGPKALVWVVATVWGDNWGVASAISLLLVAASGLAALRLLRMLFGDRPAILIPLAVYVLTPLTLADLGWWTAALESLPLQLATFMALAAHVLFVRTGRIYHLAAAAIWIAFGLACFEKALLLPLLLFGVTSGFLVDARSWLAGSAQAAKSYWRAWAIYAALMLGYAALLARTLPTSQVPTAPAFGQVLSFTEVLVKNTFITGAFGGPWTWFPIPDGSYALASPPRVLSWLALVAAVVTIGVSVLRRRKAMRAWLILAVWLVGDIVPVVIGRLSDWPAVILGLETRYVADAAPVLAICLALAFWRTTDEASPLRSGQHGRSAVTWPGSTGTSAGRPLAWSLAVVLVIGAIWSSFGYGHATSGAPAAAYVANAQRAVSQAPVGQPVLDGPVPSFLMINAFGNAINASNVVGALERGKMADKLRWMTLPAGTVDNLMLFGPDGRLHLAVVYGTSSTVLPASSLGCWPNRGGRIVLYFGVPSPSYTSILRIAYLWRSATAGAITVGYGSQYFRLPVQPGLHAAYLHVTGRASAVIVTGFGQSSICIGNAQAGYLGMAFGGPTIPAS
jgi:hypothetical protein